MPDRRQPPSAPLPGGGQGRKPPPIPKGPIKAARRKIDEDAKTRVHKATPAPPRIDDDQMTVRKPAPTSEQRYRMSGMRWAHPLGQVFNAVDGETGDRVVVTLLHPAKALTDAHVDASRATANVLAGIVDPHINGIIDVQRHPENRLALVTEYINASVLAEQVGKKVLPPARVIAILRQVCRALGDAHRAGVSHGALSAASVLLTGTQGRPDAVVVTDFGLQGIVDAELEIPSVGAALQPVTPERILGLPRTDKEDIYLVGCLGYIMLTGGPPFRTGSAQAVQRRHAIEDPMPIEERLRSARLPPPALTAVIHRCLAKEQDERFADMADLEAELCLAQIDAGISTPWDDLPLPQVEEARKQRILAGLQRAGRSKPADAGAPMTVETAASRPISIDDLRTVSVPRPLPPKPTAAPAPPKVVAAPPKIGAVPPKVAPVPPKIGAVPPKIGERASAPKIAAPKIAPPRLAPPVVAPKGPASKLAPAPPKIAPAPPKVGPTTTKPASAKTGFGSPTIGAAASRPQPAEDPPALPQAFPVGAIESSDSGPIGTGDDEPTDRNAPLPVEERQTLVVKAVPLASATVEPTTAEPEPAAPAPTATIVAPTKPEPEPAAPAPASTIVAAPEPEPVSTIVAPPKPEPEPEPAAPTPASTIVAAPEPEPAPAAAPPIVVAPPPEAAPSPMPIAAPTPMAAPAPAPVAEAPLPAADPWTASSEAYDDLDFAPPRRPWALYAAIVAASLLVGFVVTRFVASDDDTPPPTKTATDTTPPPAPTPQPAEPAPEPEPEPEPTPTPEAEEPEPTPAATPTEPRSTKPPRGTKKTPRASTAKSVEASDDGEPSGNAAALFAEGNRAFNSGNFAKASSLLSKAVKQAPNNAKYRLSLGDALFKQGKYQIARIHYVKARELGHPSAARRVEAVDAKLGG